MKKRKILVAMSGGVDSSVTAALLQEAGHEVGGATIRTWAPNDCEDLNTRACCGLSGVEDARDVAMTLDIPYWVFNFEKNFKASVVDYFASEYKQGRTPNPCIACNEHVKFRQFLVRARQLGFDTIATGHYARLEYDEGRNAYYIAEGADASKDQSYVLFPLDQEVLSNTLLPLGGYTKPEIRQKARALGLESVMAKPDSQEICFIPSNDYGTFLEKRYEDQNANPNGALPGEGLVKTTDGKVLGKHPGYFHFTRGQRRGLGIPHAEKLYVVNVDPVQNEVIVGLKHEVLNLSCRISRMNWFLKPAIGETLDVAVKIRSQHRKARAKIHIQAETEIEVVFEEPQDAITPGQAGVVYDGSRVLGGGWIQQVMA
jgi:tRNA-specific 2-thiouridylase